MFYIADFTSSWTVIDTKVVYWTISVTRQVLNNSHSELKELRRFVTLGPCMSQAWAILVPRLSHCLNPKYGIVDQQMWRKTIIDFNFFFFQSSSLGFTINYELSDDSKSFTCADRETFLAFYYLFSLDRQVMLFFSSLSLTQPPHQNTVFFSFFFFCKDYTKVSFCKEDCFHFSH